MANEIKCPNCGNTVNVEDVIAADIEQKVQAQNRQKFNEALQKIEEEKRKLQLSQEEFEEKRKKENEIFSQKLQVERQKMEAEVHQQLRKSISADYDNQLKLLQERNNDNAEKLKEARRQELEYLQLKNQLAAKEEELDIIIEKRLLQERVQLTEQIHKREVERNVLKETEYQLKVKELEKQLEDQKKLADEMRRRSEQGSMQLQGEVQELLLEKILRQNFPFDSIEEVGKGIEGADCIQVIRNQAGHECGRIIYESKRTKGWNDKWLEKLKTDKRQSNSDVAILVTQTYPKGMTCFGEKDGIWVCSFDELSSVSCVIRHGVIKVFEAHKREEYKGDKMQLLYDYLTGLEFKGHIEAIAEGFMSMRNSITRERMQMEKIWKEREKQLEKVLLSTSGLYGSVKGIAGASVGDIPLLDGGDKINEIEY